jgi:hypothetical protein
MLNKILYEEDFYFSIVLALVGIFLLVYRQYFMSNFIKTNAVLSGIAVKKRIHEGSNNNYYDWYFSYGIYGFDINGKKLIKEECRGTLLKKLKENMIGNTEIIFVNKNNLNKIFSKRWLDEILLYSIIFFAFAALMALMVIMKIIHGY